MTSYEEMSLTELESEYKQLLKKQVVGLNGGFSATVEIPDGMMDPSGDREGNDGGHYFDEVVSFIANEGLTGFKDYEAMANDYKNSGVVAFTNYPVNCPNTTRAEWHAELFADVIWLDVLCKSDFLDKNITVKGLDFTAGGGGVVQLRHMNVASPSQDFTAMSPCGCLSCVSNTLATYTLTMEQYGDFHQVCDVDAFTIGEGYQRMVMQSMAVRGKERIDNKINLLLQANAGTYSESLDTDCYGSKTYGMTTDGCGCSHGTNFYEHLINLEATMRDAGYFDTRDPVLIVNPNVIAHLKYGENPAIPSFMASQIVMDGVKIAKIGNISVIESCHSSDCNAVAESPQAYLIDPARAIGEAWGKRPTFKTQEVIECEKLKVVYTQWCDFAVLDVNAIGKILNPA